MNNQIEQVLSHIDEAKLTGLLCNLVDINSPTGEEGDCARFLAGYLAEMGLRTQLQDLGPNRSNVIGIYPGEGGGPVLMLFGHLDTSFAGRQDEDYPVAGALPPGLLAKSYVREGKIYGLGSFNMKGGVACATAAIEAIIKSGVKLRGDVMIAGLAGESEKSPVDGLYSSFRGPRYNGAGYGARYMLQHGLLCDCAIECEPTSGYIVNARTGYIRVKLIVKGRVGYQTHIGTNSPSFSAIDKAFKAIEAINTWIPEYTKKHSYDSVLGIITPHVSIGAIESGAPYFPAFRPGICHVYVEIRTAPGQAAMEALNEFKSVLQDVANSDPQFNFDVEVYASNTPGMATPPSAQVIQTMLEAQELILGHKQSKYPPEVAVASSDANFFRLRGIPVATCGPGGSMEMAGGIDTWGVEGEYQRIDDLITITKMYIVAILDLCSRPREELYRSPLRLEV